MGPYVLVVDDDSDVRNLIAEALSLMGLEARQARHGQEAIRAVEEEVPGAIVLDLIMPVMDGFSTLAALQRNKAWRGIPVVVMSALLEADHRIAAFPGVIGMIQKSSFDITLLARMMEKAGLREINAA